ncbi:MAG: hypothetical protein R3229_10260 [Alphaproteobacteria bacterium]|nr:hypothetical protein [Alphaproteobacteria bacterium]
MIRRSLLPSVALSLFLFLPTHVKAEEVVCTEREEMVEQLVSDFDEHLAAVRDIKGEGLLEIHVSAQTGSWTALLTKHWNLSCILADGDDAPVPDILKLETGV